MMKKKPSMFRSILLTITIVLIAAMALFTTVLYNTYTDDVESQLASSASLIAQTMSDDGSSLKELDLDDLRLTWIDSDGTVLYDSEKDASEMENHGSRPEVRDAFLNGTGESVRTSTTLSKKTIYYALLLDSNTVLRVSRSYDSLFILVLRMMSPVLGILVVGLIASLILNHHIQSQIMHIPDSAIKIDE